MATGSPIVGASIVYDGDSPVTTDSTGLASGISINVSSGTLIISATGYQSKTISNFSPTDGQTYDIQLTPVSANSFSVHTVDDKTGASITTGSVSYAGGTSVPVDANGVATLEITQASGTLVASAPGYGTSTTPNFTPVAGTTYAVKLSATVPVSTTSTLVVASLVIFAIIGALILR